jgi:hypothetical protein
MKSTISVDQIVNFLNCSFKEFDSETLLMVLQANNYDVNKTIVSLVEMEKANANTSKEKKTKNVASNASNSSSESNNSLYIAINN